MMPHLTGCAVLDQGHDHHSFLGLLLFQAEAKTHVILEEDREKKQTKKSNSEPIISEASDSVSHIICSCYHSSGINSFCYSKCSKILIIHLSCYMICVTGGLTVVDNVLAKSHWRFWTWGRMMCWSSLDNPPGTEESVWESTLSSHSVLDSCVVWPRAALFLIKAKQLYYYPKLVINTCILF